MYAGLRSSDKRLLQGNEIETSRHSQAGLGL
jgi:hypothetical protein